MNRPELFRKSIDTLATAYFEGSLEAGSCSACAVGNLIRAEGVTSPDALENWYWRLKDYRSDTRPLTRSVTDVLPYTPDEIDRIESAFEDRTCRWEEDQEIFPALMQVVDALFDIHDVTDQDLRSDAKAAFDGDYETVENVL